jgi:hypothetical protein
MLPDSEPDRTSKGKGKVVPRPRSRRNSDDEEPGPEKPATDTSFAVPRVNNSLWQEVEVTPPRAISTPTDDLRAMPDSKRRTRGVAVKSKPGKRCFLTGAIACLQQI